MSYLRRFVKHPLEKLDYDIDFASWLAARSDSISTFTLSVDTGITLDSAVAVGGVIRGFISGGTNGRAYEAAASINTTGGRIKRGRILIRVRGRATTGDSSGGSGGGGGGSFDTRPRFGVGAADAYLTPETLLAAMSILTGGVNDGHDGTFSLTTSAGTYGWVAVEATNSSAGVHFFDGLGYGGWSGAGAPGNYSGSSDDPSTSIVTFVDTNGTEWRLFRQDYENANAVASTYTVS